MMGKLMKTMYLDDEAVDYLDERKKNDSKFNVSQFISDILIQLSKKESAIKPYIIKCGKCSAEYSSIMKACPGCEMHVIKAQEQAEKEAENILNANAEAERDAQRVKSIAETEKRLKEDIILYEELIELIEKLPNDKKIELKSYYTILDKYRDAKVRIGVANIREYAIHYLEQKEKKNAPSAPEGDKIGKATGTEGQPTSV